ncbi:MAG TPA: hypothetical protein VF049_04965 [Nocardioidaceae bacterium]
MNFVPDHVATQLDHLVQPTSAEVLRAKAVAQDGECASNEQLRRAVVEDGAGKTEPDQHAFIQLHEVIRDRAVELDRAEPLILRARLELAAEEALAELAVDGVICGGGLADVTLSVGDITDGGGTRGGYNARVVRPRFEATYRLERRYAAEASLMEVATALDSTTLGDVLGGRGQRCFQEAVRAFRRGLYLAAANLAGVAAEAAWYTIANAAATREPRLGGPLRANNTAKVVQLSAEILRQPSGAGIAINELQTQVAHLRDLRNYAVHPRPMEDAHLEANFTEVGCLALLSTTVRHLARLRSAAQAANLL